MSGSGLSFYLLTLLVYAGVDVLACLALNLQYGFGGILNLAVIVFQSAGAYTAAVLSLPASSANGGFQSYIGGLHLAFPLPWVGAAVVGGLVAIPFTPLMSRRVRVADAGLALLVLSVTANLLVTNYRPLVNGSAGLALIPAPLSGELSSLTIGYQTLYAVAAILVAAIGAFFLRLIVNSPYGRTLRAVRDRELVAASMGKDVRRIRSTLLILGGALAGLSGGVLVGFIGTWDPNAWGYGESVVLLAAVIVGGAGNLLGSAVGAVLVPVIVLEGSQLIPSFGPPGLVPALDWVLVGMAIITCLWFRPQGLVPERRYRFMPKGAAGPRSDGPSDAIEGPPSAIDGRGADKAFP